MCLTPNSISIAQFRRCKPLQFIWYIFFVVLLFFRAHWLNRVRHTYFLTTSRKCVVADASIATVDIDLKIFPSNCMNMTEYFCVCVLKLDWIMYTYVHIYFFETRATTRIHANATVGSASMPTISMEIFELCVFSLYFIFFHLHLTVDNRFAIMQANGPRRARAIDKFSDPFTVSHFNRYGIASSEEWWWSKSAREIEKNLNWDEKSVSWISNGAKAIKWFTKLHTHTHYFVFLWEIKYCNTT